MMIEMVRGNMEIRKLSSNSEKLLLEIVQAKNPTQALNTKELKVVQRHIYVLT